MSCPEGDQLEPPAQDQTLLTTGLAVNALFLSPAPPLFWPVSHQLDIMGQSLANTAFICPHRGHWTSQALPQGPSQELESWVRVLINLPIRQLVRRRQWHPTPILLPGKFHGRSGLVCCSPWGREESNTTERLHFHFSLSCIGEGNGNPLQCSCLETPRDGGTWWAAVNGVEQGRTRLK